MVQPSPEATSWCLHAPSMLQPSLEARGHGHVMLQPSSYDMLTSAALAVAPAKEVTACSRSCASPPCLACSNLLLWLRRRHRNARMRRAHLRPWLRHAPVFLC
eukprot:256013-Pelagomonas_calceolata.AAC.1